MHRGVPHPEQAMSNLTRWNPFRTRMQPFADLDALLRELVPVLGNDNGNELRIDVSEDDKAFAVKADVPGIDKKDLDVTVEGNRVTISGETKRETKKGEGTNAVYSERFYGKVYRTFTLPVDVDAENVVAQCADGVLTLKLPKKPNGSSRRIAVS
jgi:HSP20 family protein